MESKRYAKTIGGGVSLPLPTTAIQPSPSGTCQHITIRGHRCHMLTSDPNSLLCAHHARQQLKFRRRQHDAAAKELLGNIEDFSTADAVNAFLGNLVKQLARKRIARRDAIALAYVSQLLLNSLSALDRQLEAEKDATAGQFLLNSLRKPDRDETPGRPDNGSASDARSNAHFVRPSA
jgi:hypothetical protein